MKSKLIAILFFLLVLLVPCFSIGFSEEEQRIINVLYENKETDSSSGRDISFIKKVNMGVPGGDNYVLVKNGDLIVTYVIDNDTIVAKYVGTVIFDPAKESKFDIMKDIPGTRIGNGSGVIGDYNNDGIDEIFVYLFGGYLTGIAIYGCNITQNTVVSYATIPFNLVDPENGPAPFEFITYQGIDGFKVYQDIYNHPPTHPSKHSFRDYLSWYFYAWDEGRREFVELAEIGEDIDYTMFSNYKPEEPEIVEPEPDMDIQACPETPESTEPIAEETIVKPEQRNIVPVIAVVAGLFVAGFVLCGILLLRRKK
jgi:hypothetical protein